MYQPEEHLDIEIGKNADFINMQLVSYAYVRDGVYGCLRRYSFLDNLWCPIVGIK
jgi:hypothetical protein